MPKTVAATLVVSLFFAMFVVLQASCFTYDISPPKEALCRDLNGDGKVTIEDALVIASYFGTAKGMPTWNQKVDIDTDGYAGIVDVFLFCLVASVH